MKEKAAALPRDLSIGDSRNWNFDDVAEVERWACCVWEYARESASIRDAVTQWKHAGRFPSQSDNKAGLLLYRTGFKLEFWESLPFPDPWLSVDITERQKWAEPKNPRPKFPPFQATGNFWVLSTLYDEAHEARERRQAEWVKVNKSGDVDNAALLEQADTAAAVEQEKKPNPVSFWAMGGVQYFAAVQVNWGDYTNERIVDTFRKWVKANRPKCSPNRTGRPAGKFDPFAALDGLAIMRLLHHCKPPEAQTKAPKLCHRHSGQQLFAARQAARKTFRIIFPLLPKAERPLSWLTKGGRSR